MSVVYGTPVRVLKRQLTSGDVTELMAADRIGLLTDQMEAGMSSESNAVMTPDQMRQVYEQRKVTYGRHR